MTADQRSDSMLPHFRTYCPVQLQLTMIVGLLVVVLGCDPITETTDSRAKSDATDAGVHLKDPHYLQFNRKRKSQHSIAMSSRGS